MEVKVCKNCRRLFNYMFGPELCPECARTLWENKMELNMTEETSQLSPIIVEDEEKYKRIKDYIATHPNATVAQIAEDNDISPTKIFEWIREDRMAFSDQSDSAWLICEGCGTKIRSGRFCNRCKPY